MKHKICVHGHFYQPPRENPWLEAIEVQDSAYPFHDWNERIAAECYRPNSASRVLDDEGLVVEIVNNYSRMSFNFGPTLLSWLETEATPTYEALLEADRVGQERFSGHGPALAQAYNHIIMPLASRAEKQTQVIWGIRDFIHRFQRRPEGMWLPETAVDLETLEILVQQGIKFTVLAPRQAHRFRKIGNQQWTDVSDGGIDPKRPYIQNLPSGKSIAIFFYDGIISQAVAFEGLLNSGETFADRLLTGFGEDSGDEDELVNIATDGESYGHHHRKGDMALAYAMNHLESKGLASITVYGEYLENHPPQFEVDIYENSSWSCVHGVERWRSDCGCNSGGNPRWSQQWRGPLREALDWLRDETAKRFNEEAAKSLRDPAGAVDNYIEVVLDRSPEQLKHFLTDHASGALDEGDKIRLLKLLETQRNSMLMHTSCGWFFDELSGIETVQVIQYAGRVVQLSNELFTDGIEEQFLTRLEKAKSNVPEHRDGRNIYEKWVRPAAVGLFDVGAHFAISSLFEESGARPSRMAYDVSLERYSTEEVGRTKLSVGRAKVASRVTREVMDLTFGALHMGDQNIAAGVREWVSEDEAQGMVSDVTAAFHAADFAEVIRSLDRHFGASTYSLRSLFRDEQREVLRRILASSLESAEGVYRALYEQEAPMMRFLVSLGSPVPRVFQTAAEFFFNSTFRRELEADGKLDVERVWSLVEEARALDVDLDEEGLGYLLSQAIHKMLKDLTENLEDLETLDRLASTADLAQSGPFQADLWEAQNLYYELLQSGYSASLTRARETRETADRPSRDWAEKFEDLGRHLLVRVD